MWLKFKVYIVCNGWYFRVVKYKMSPVKRRDEYDGLMVPSRHLLLAVTVYMIVEHARTWQVKPKGTFQVTDYSPRVKIVKSTNLLHPWTLRRKPPLNPSRERLLSIYRSLNYTKRCCNINSNVHSWYLYIKYTFFLCYSIC